MSSLHLGARLGVTEHRADNARVFRLRLMPEDNQAISAVLARSNGRNLINSMGDCGSEYRFEGYITAPGSR